MFTSNFINAPPRCTLKHAKMHICFIYNSKKPLLVISGSIRLPPFPVAGPEKMAQAQNVSRRDLVTFSA